MEGWLRNERLMKLEWGISLTAPLVDRTIIRRKAHLSTPGTDLRGESGVQPAPNR
ncbi:hypothetical protein Mal15_61030 [Stieleria maiorica]|uniref:Uncharacterized protein n=1 Tax=Stieleria maiorica TaxID=2795974 RepID=A0A5B9MNT6_9BACT|nr:hypothetical protein Mal15_61030 [Stieleria maiorica]